MTLNKEQVLYHLRSLKKEITPEGIDQKKLAEQGMNYAGRENLTRKQQAALEKAAPRIEALTTAMAFIEEHHG
jgi:hypothetical protein